MRKHWSCTFAALATLAALAIAMPAGAQIDRSFGGYGYVGIGFAAEGNGAAHDFGIAACPGPSGTLVAVGTASDGSRVVTAWLTPGGALDPAFSSDGKESFHIADGIRGAVGLCTSDGGIVLAYASMSAHFQPDLNAVYLVRIDPATGKPDPAFGKAGIVRVDLDKAATDLGDHTQLTALVQGANHDLLLLGNTRLDVGPMSPTAGFLMRIERDGMLAATQVTSVEDASIRDIVAAGVAANGDIWIGGNRIPPPAGNGTGFLARLDGLDLTLLDMPQPSLGDSYRVAGGRVIDGTRMAMVGSRFGRQFFATLDPETTRIVNLPTELDLERPQILPLPGKRLLIAASAVDFLSVGTWFAQMRPLGGGRYVPDTAFGDGGGYLAQAHLPLDCGGETVQLFNRATLWNGAPTAIGAVNRACVGHADFDYLVLRLRADLVFGDGLETY